MKKIMIIVVACMVSVTVFGQIKFGIKAGGNVSNLSGMTRNDGKTYSGSDIIGGFHAGGYFNYSFNDMLGVQAEVIFSMQGGKIENIDAKKTVQRLNYINIPLLLDIKPFKVPVSFFVGPQFGYCISHSPFVYGPLIENEKFKDFDFAIAVGVQYTLIDHLTVGLRTNIGLIPSLECDYATSPVVNAKGERNNVLQLSAGWTF